MFRVVIARASHDLGTSHPVLRAHTLPFPNPFSSGSFVMVGLARQSRRWSDLGPILSGGGDQCRRTELELGADDLSVVDLIHPQGYRNRNIRSYPASNTSPRTDSDLAYVAFR